MQLVISELSDNDRFVERHAERTLARLNCADSTSHGIKMRHFPDVLTVQDEQGSDVTIKASAVCDVRTVRAFLRTKGLQDLVIASYVVDNLAIDYATYLRTDYKKKNKNSKYYLIEHQEDIFWLVNICIFAIAECIGWNKRELQSFIDDRAATLADLGFVLRRIRGYTHEAPNHMVKHKEDDQQAEETANLLQSKIAEIVEKLAEKDLPGYSLDPLPAGVPIPLQLPMGKKKGAKADE
jgi:hypothetical protein